MAEVPYENQRKHPRLTKPFMVRYRPMGAEPAGWLASPLRDLSSGGARFISEHAFAVGDLMELQLLLPVPEQPLQLSARVAWVKSANPTLREVGVTFDPGDVGIQQLIDQVVTRFLDKQRRDA